MALCVPGRGGGVWSQISACYQSVRSGTSVTASVCQETRWISRAGALTDGNVSLLVFRINRSTPLLLLLLRRAHSFPQKKPQKKPALQKPWRSELCLWLPTVARVEEEQWIMGAPMQNERKIFLKLPAEQLSSPGVRELRIWFVFNFTIPLLFSHLTPGQWRRRPRARLLQLEGTRRRITTRLPIRLRDIISNPARDNACARVAWLRAHDNDSF